MWDFNPAEPHLLKRVTEPKSAFESGNLSLVVHPSQRNSRLEAAVKQRQLNWNRDVKISNL